jgi:hypothetical protein
MTKEAGPERDRADDSASDCQIARKQEAAWDALGVAPGVTLDDVRRMSLVQLATFLVTYPRLDFVVSLELQRRPRTPDPAAGRVLVRAYRAQRLDGYRTATFLASMPAEDGYEVAAEILRGARGAHGEWGAGPPAADAMVVHDAFAACVVLFELICDETAPRGLRRGIALTLNAMRDARIVPAIFEAVRAGRLGPVLGAAAIQLHPVETDRLVEWLGLEDGAANLAFDVIRRHRYLAVDEAVARAIRAALDAGRLRLSASERERFEQGLADAAEERAWLAPWRKEPLGP